MIIGAQYAAVGRRLRSNILGILGWIEREERKKGNLAYKTNQVVPITERLLGSDTPVLPVLASTNFVI